MSLVGIIIAEGAAVVNCDKYQLITCA